MVHQFAIGVVKGWQTVDHLVYQNPQRPPVDALSVRLEMRSGRKHDHFPDDFGSKVLGSATKGMRSVSFDSLLGEAKVRDADVTLRIQDEILRLQVTVNDVVVVEMADPHRDFGGVELGSVLR